MLLTAGFSVAQTPLMSKNIDSTLALKLNQAKTVKQKKTIEQRLAGSNVVKKTINNVQGTDSSKRDSKFGVEDVVLGTGIQQVGNNYRTTYLVEGQVSLFKLPIDIQLSNNFNYGFFGNPFSGSLFKAGLDKQLLLKSMVPEVDNYKDVRENLFGGKEPTAMLRQQMTETIKKSGNEQLAKFSRVHEYINQRGNIEELLRLDGPALRKKLAELMLRKKDSEPDIADPLRTNGKTSSLLNLADTSLTKKLTKLEQQKKGSVSDLGVSVDPQALQNPLKLNDPALRKKFSDLTGEKTDSVTNETTIILEKAKVQDEKFSESLLDTLVRQVGELKGLLESYGVPSGRVGDIERQLRNRTPGLSGYASKYVPESFLMKNFGGLSNLEVGSFGQQLPGSFMNRDLFLQGASVSIQTRRGPLKLGLASVRDIGFAKDEGLEHSNFSLQRTVAFVGIPLISRGYVRSRISWTGGFGRQTYRPNGTANVSTRSGSALALSQELGSEKSGRFTFELSKSVAGFRNVALIGSEHVLLQRNTFGNYFKDDFLETMSVGAKYNFDNQRLGMNTNLFLSYSGIGFQSPAQQGLANMGLRMGGSIRKSLVKNRIVLNMRGDLKNTPVSGVADAKWQNHNLNLEARFRLFRKLNFSLKYMDNGVQKIGKLQQVVYGSKKYQFNASGNYRLFKKASFSNMALGLQQMDNPLFQSNNQFLTCIYTQSLVLGGATLTGNLFYNRELGSQPLLGNMVSADAAVQYRLLENISASSALTYLDNTRQARQVGIKQNIQFTAWKKMEINIYADVRKNMIKPLYPELFASNRAEFSIKYYFK
jgi:hypothetical protein